MAFCPKCGNPTRANLDFCTQCGATIKQSSNNSIPVTPNQQHAAQAGPTEIAHQNKPHQPVTPSIAKAVIRGLSKSILLSTIAIGPGIGLLLTGYPVSGMIWMFIGSFWLMARTYKKPWRLTFLTCFTPPAAALTCYLLQLWLFADDDIAVFQSLSIAILLGMLFGWWRASKHTLSRAKDGGIIAKRNLGFLVVWVLSYGVTQLLGYLSADVLIIRAGLMTGAFSTAVLIIVSLLIWRRFKLERAAISLVAVVCLLFIPVEAPIAQEQVCGLTKSALQSDAKAVLSTTGLQYFSQPNEMITTMEGPRDNDCVFKISYGHKGKPDKKDASGATVLASGLKGKDIHYTVNALGRISKTIEPPQSTNLDTWAHLKAYKKISIGSSAQCKYMEEMKPALRMFHLYYIGTARVMCIKNSRLISITVDGKYYGGKPTQYNKASFYRDLAVQIAQRVLPQIPKAESISTLPPPASHTESKNKSRIDIGTDYNPQNSTGVNKPPSVLSPSEEEIALITAAVISILVAAGIAINIAQSIAIAIANAVQTTTESTINTVAEEFVRSDPVMPDTHQYPPLYDPYDKQPLEERDGRYWAARAGEAGRWMSREEAERYVGELHKEKAAFDKQRQDEIQQHDSETEAMLDQWREDTQKRHAAEKERELAEQETRRKTRESIQREGDADPLPDSEIPTPEGDLFVTPGIDNSGIGWGINMVEGFVKGSAKDIIELITKSPGAIADTMAEAGGKLEEILSDPENWRVAGEAAVETIKDIYGAATGNRERSQKVAENLAEGGSAAAKVAGHLAKETWNDPAGAATSVIKIVLGTDNWQKAIDPDVPVTERMGRALWGVVDTGGIVVGVGSKAMKGAAKLGDFMRTADTAGDLMRGGKMLDSAGDTLKAADALGDTVKSAATADTIADTAKSGHLIDSAGDAGKAVDGVGDSTKSGRLVDSTGDTAKSAEATQDLANGAKASETGTAGRETIDEMRERLANQRKGPVNTPEGAAARGNGIPNRVTDPEGYVRELPSGALVDRNLAIGTGYTGAQIDDMAKFAKQENVIVGARSTNVDSMRHIRDGNAVPKPITIKSKTVSELDTYLGMKTDDKGLVGYFKPKEPLDLTNVPDHLKAAVSERHQTRLKEYSDNWDDIQKAIKEGTMAEKDGKLHAVLKKADGTTELKPYAGDIDGVYFADGTTGELIPPGERYDRLKAAWTGNTEKINQEIAEGAIHQGKAPDLIPDYWEKSKAPGQHGVESNLVADVTSGKTPGTPDYQKALDKYQPLHEKLAGNHWKGNGETVLQMGPDGNLRRGIRFTESNPLPDLADPRYAGGEPLPNVSDWLGKREHRPW
ncbi:hypothetical protein [Sedimenticola selenatireducens]|uniref:Zinc-ribbon domain-containing protein n=1 Tax=Sedimenticola selenatireducens TaxID=191960 RepID=A0A558DVI2_9GAMM|nr:hypothetical protein [Sedimenticola selenatireducens]TVO77741.1 hypothetical protein FHP88_02770 [Sedimenticola selenatireducens]TVT65046.1 MAG: hypothetical protein FHK78_05135 [Sedimenticola selenatireducens]